MADSAGWRVSSARAWGALIFLFAIYFGLVLFSSQRVSPAYDEPTHIRAGMAVLTRGAYVDPQKAWWTQTDPLTPPIDILPALLARLSGQSPDYRNDMRTDYRHVVAARYASHLMGALTILIIFLWGRRLWGDAGGLLSAASLLLMPIFIGHSTIVSSDLSMALGGVAAAYAIWRIILEKPDFLRVFGKQFWLGGSLLGLALGFALICKLSNFMLLLMLPVATAWAIHLQAKQEILEFKKQLIQWIAVTALPLAVALIFVAAIFDLGGLKYPPIETLFGPERLFFGHAFVYSLLKVLTLAPFRPPVFFFGEIEPGSPKHFFAAYFLKTPFPLLALHAIGLAASISLMKKSDRSRSVAYPVLLIGVLAAAFSTRGLYLGLRHWLLPLVLLSLPVGSIAAVMPPLSRARAKLTATLAIALTVWGLVDVSLVSPWHLSYFNAFAGKQIALADSDGDWGEGLLALAEWQKKWSPDDPIWLAYFGNAVPDDFGVHYKGLLAPYALQTTEPGWERAREPALMEGWVAISKTQLAGTYMYSAKPPEPADFYALWRKIEPDFVVGGTIHIYDARGEKKVSRDVPTD